MDALLKRGTLANLMAEERESGFVQWRLEAQLGYGMPAFGDGLTSTPEIGFGFSGERCGNSLGWRLEREARAVAKRAGRP